MDAVEPGSSRMRLSIGGAGATPDLAAPARLYLSRRRDPSAIQAVDAERQAVVEDGLICIRGPGHDERGALEALCAWIAPELEVKRARTVANPGASVAPRENCPPLLGLLARSRAGQHDDEVGDGVRRENRLVPPGRELHRRRDHSRPRVIRLSRSPSEISENVGAPVPAHELCRRSALRHDSSRRPAGWTWRSRIPVEVAK